MSLSCSCGDWDMEPGNWAYYRPDDFTKLNTRRRRRCASCGKPINIGEECLEFERERCAYNEVDGRINGEIYSISPLYQCTDCGEIYLNLTDAGFCLCPTDDMPDALLEYWERTGFKPIKEGG